MNVVELLQRLYEAAPPATRMIAQVALLFGCMGLGVSLLHAAWRRRSARALRKVVDRAQETSAGEAEAGSLEARWEELANVPAPRAFRRALERLNNARRRAIGGPEEVWRGAFDRIFEEEASRESLVRGIASAAVLVGLLGTVIGFADLSSGLVTLTTGSSGAAGALENNGTGGDLHGRLAGVFSSTVAGIVASLMILIGGVPILRASADRWLSAVEDAGRIVIVPSLPRPPTRVQDLLIEELQRRMEAVVGAWQACLTEPANALVQAAENSRRSAEAAAGAFEGLSVSVSDLRQLGQSAGRIKNAATSMEQTAKTYVTASVRLADVVTALEGTLPPLSASLTTVGDGLVALEAKIDKGSQAVVDAGAGLRDSVQQLAGAFTKLEGAVASRHDKESAFLDETRGAVTLLAERLEGLRSVEEAIKDHIHESNVAMGSVGLEIRTALVPLNNTLAVSIRETFGQLLRDHGNLLSGAIQQIQASAAETLAQLGQLQGAREELLRSARAASASADQLAAGAQEIRSSVPDPRPVQLAIERVGDVLDRIAHDGAGAKVDPALIEALRALATGSAAAARSDAVGEQLAKIHGALQRISIQLARDRRWSLLHDLRLRVRLLVDRFRA